MSRRNAEFGLTSTDAAEAGTLTVVDVGSADVADTCLDRRVPGVKWDYIRRRLVDLPVVGFPTCLHVRVPCFACTNPACGRKIFQASLPCVDDGAKLARRVIRWIPLTLMSVAVTAKAFGVGWELVNRVAVAATRNFVYADPMHLAGVRIPGVDEHVWKCPRRPGEPSSMITMLVDLIGMRPGRSADVLQTWLHERDPQFRAGV